MAECGACSKKKSVKSGKSLFSGKKNPGRLWWEEASELKLKV